MDKVYQQCTKCVLDNSPRTNLTFDKEGVCNNCKAYDNYVKLYMSDQNALQNELQSTIANIKKDGQGKEYDCILGISGGVDSSYLAYLSKKLGLRPLVVHFDNGWNSELSVQNIHNIVENLKFDLNTYVIDWEEFRDLQLAYIRASVIDIEVPTDHFIYATLHEVAHKNKIKYILDGNNIVTEFWGTSARWGFSKVDLVNMLNIHKKFGTIPLKKYPKLGFYQRYFYEKICNIRSVRLLNLVPYHRAEVIKTIETELGWKDPGGKHYESIFTRFYQGYILPKKFKVDKRKVHLSNLIWSGQMIREEALNILKEEPYPLELQNQDKEYVLKKFGLSESEFERIMAEPIVEHEAYGTEQINLLTHQRFEKLMSFPVRVLRKLGLLKFIC